MAFAAQYRLHKKEDCRKIFKKPQIVKHQKYMMLLAMPNDLPHARLGLAIAKKHVKKSVDRSLVKRIIRESFRAKANSLPALDMVMLAKFGIMSMTKKNLRLAVDNIFDELR